MAIRNLAEAHRQFAEAFNAGDVTALMALYSPDAALVPQPGQVVTGQAELQQALEGYLALRGRISLETTFVVEAGDTALLRGQWQLTGKGADGQAVALAGKSVEVLRKQADGTWLFVVDHPYGAD
ncbi:MAG TPA: SgcJ/EcaC family oxidoreductase [Ramlibacter sp.]|nr:SgcJ/EcaC family oxidoreductase [Ramlibacter sp.]